MWKARLVEALLWLIVVAQLVPMLVDVVSPLITSESVLWLTRGLRLMAAIAALLLLGPLRRWIDRPPRARRPRRRVRRVMATERSAGMRR